MLLALAPARYDIGLAGKTIPVNEARSMSISGTEWLIILAVIVLVFGRGRVLRLMGDAGRGLTDFRRGIADPAGPAHPGLADPGLADPGPPPPSPGA